MTASLSKWFGQHFGMLGEESTSSQTSMEREGLTLCCTVLPGVRRCPSGILAAVQLTCCHRGELCRDSPPWLELALHDQRLSSTIRSACYSVRLWLCWLRFGSIF